MNRDPANFECTRDPIFLLQAGWRQWVQMPDGVETDGESMWVDDVSELPDWIKQFVDEDETINKSDEFWKVVESLDADNGWPMVHIDWRPELVFLTRKEAEEYAKSRAYRWDKWRVYCLPCDGVLAEILNNYQPEAKQ